MLPTSGLQLAVSAAALLAAAAVFLEIAARLNVAFEEASVRVSQLEAHSRLRKSGRAGTQVLFRGIPPPFRIPQRPTPDLAIIWKNLIACLRVSPAWFVIPAVILTILISITMARNNVDLKGGGAAIMLMLCAVFPYVGGVIFNHDLRMDLRRIEILKSYPITGERLVAAEISAPLAMISAFEIVLLVTTVIMLQFARHDLGAFGFFATPQFIVVALLFAIPICAMQLLLQNAVSILFPAWAFRSGEDSRGFAVMGQRLVVMAGMLISLCLTLIPAALLFLPAYYLSHRFFGNSPAVLAIATMPASALLAFEAWLVIKFLGAQFEKIDVTTEMGSALV